MDFLIPNHALVDHFGVYGPQTVQLNVSNNSERYYKEVKISIDPWNNVGFIDGERHFLRIEKEKDKQDIVIIWFWR